MISGGDLYINASGDGIDANGSLEISGGYTVIVGPTQGDTATLDSVSYTHLDVYRRQALSCLEQK